MLSFLGNDNVSYQIVIEILTRILKLNLTYYALLLFLSFDIRVKIGD